MISQIESLLARYESGSLSRRQLVAALAVAASAPSAPAAASGLRAVTLNHATLFVPDVERSKRFYQDLLAMPVVSRQSGGINLGAGPDSFLGLYKRDGKPEINHICFGVENFEVNKAVAALGNTGVRSRVRDRDGVKELYLQDPDGITVQLQAKDYRG